MEKIWIQGPALEGEPVKSAWSPDRGLFRPPQHLVFVSTGNAALTRRLTPDALFAVMRKPTREGYSQRIGLLVPPAVLRAAHEYLVVTQRRREAGRRQRAGVEAAYQQQFRDEILRQYPAIPDKELQRITEHSTVVGSRRAGRARQQPLAVKARLAVIAWVRHHHTNYESMLAEGWEKDEARVRVAERIAAVLHRWARTEAGDQLQPARKE